jgi:hypothetical protein
VKDINDKLFDNELIRERKAKHCRYLNAKQFDQWEVLFAPDARATF